MKSVLCKVKVTNIKNEMHHYVLVIGRSGLFFSLSLSGSII